MSIMKIVVKACLTSVTLPIIELEQRGEEYRVRPLWLFLRRKWYIEMLVERTCDTSSPSEPTCGRHTYHLATLAFGRHALAAETRFLAFCTAQCPEAQAADLRSL